MTKFLWSLLLSVFVVTPAFAAPACYAPEETKAEQLLRLHSELMVITVTCRTTSTGQDLVPSYTGFTKINISALHDAEQTMIGYYNAHEGHGVEHLDTLRTKLANEYGQKIADISAPMFCNQYRDLPPAFYRASQAQIDATVAHMVLVERPYVAPCGGNTVVARASIPKN